MRVPGMWCPSELAISDVLFLLGICVSLRIWAAMGESSPSLISLLNRAFLADADDTGGWGEPPVSTVRAYGSQVLLLALILIITLPRG